MPTKFILDKWGNGYAIATVKHKRVLKQTFKIYSSKGYQYHNIKIEVCKYDNNSDWETIANVDDENDIEWAIMAYCELEYNTQVIVKSIDKNNLQFYNDVYSEKNLNYLDEEFNDTDQIDLDYTNVLSISKQEEKESERITTDAPIRKVETSKDSSGCFIVFILCILFCYIQYESNTKVDIAEHAGVSEKDNFQTYAQDTPWNEENDNNYPYDTIREENPELPSDDQTASNGLEVNHIVNNKNNDNHNFSDDKNIFKDAAKAVDLDNSINSNQPVINRVEGTFYGWTGSTEFMLSDGSIWRQNGPGLSIFTVYNPRVFIYYNTLNFGTIMYVEGDNYNEYVKVIRIN